MTQVRELLVAAIRRSRKSIWQFCTLLLTALMSTLVFTSTPVHAADPVPNDVVSIYWLSDTNPSTPGHQLILQIGVGNADGIQGTFYVYEGASVPISGTAIDSLQINQVGGNLEFTSLTNVGAATRFSVKFVSDNATFSDTNFENIRPPCNPGRYSADGFGPCIPAPAGSVVPIPGATRADPCTPGYFQPIAGGTSCMEPEPGRYVPGFGATTALPCGMGTFSANTGAAICDPAPIGYYVDTPGSISAIQCEPNYTTPAAGASICQRDEDTLASVPTAIWNSPENGNIEMSFSTSPVVAGTITVYQSSHIAGSPRVAGTASITSGASSASINLSFDSSISSDLYSVKFESSNSNHNTTYWENISALCGPGNFSNTGSTPCDPTPAGTFALSTGNTAAVECAPGTYQPNTRQSTCLNAPAGTYVDQPGAINPTSCPSGYFNADIAAISSSACTAASPGNFVDDNDKSRQQPCSKGTYQNTVGQSSCTPARIGYFVNTVGASSQKKCKRTFTTSTIGSTACKLKPKEPRLPRTVSRTKISTVYLKNGKTSDGLRVILKSESTTCQVRRSSAGYTITGKRKGKCSITVTVKGNKTFASVTQTRKIKVI